MKTKRIRDLKRGDHVVLPNGALVRVRAVHPARARNYYVVQYDGAPNGGGHGDNEVEIAYPNPAAVGVGAVLAATAISAGLVGGFVWLLQPRRA